jgi:predicted O-linked N-acetylglucosamine transferase (SPINDLY family)
MVSRFFKFAPKPDAAVACYKRGNSFKDQGQLAEAVASYDEAIALDPTYAFALCNRGVVLARLNRLDAALDSYDRAIAINAGDPLAFFNRASVLHSLGRPEEALASFDRALALKPDYVESYCNRGNLLNELGRSEEAVASYDRAIEIQPNFFEAYFGRGTARQRLDRGEDALTDFDHALALKPSSAEAQCNRGVALMKLRRWDSALASLDRAIALNPNLAEAYANRGKLLAELRRHEAAVESFDRAIALRPRDVEAHEQRAVALVQMMRFVQAIESYDQVIALDPDRRFALGMCRYAKMNVCDWRDLSTDIERITAGIAADRAVSTPFPVLALLDAPHLHQKVARIWVREECPPNREVPPIPQREPRDRLRVGYFSGDFREHPVAVLMAQVLESHDRRNIAVTAFSYGPPVQDAMQKRLASAFDRFEDVRGRSDKDVAALARELEIDVAVDLAGYTGGSPSGVFARRAAPIQINYLGYPGTMGAEYMDYLIADRTVIPPGQRGYYDEKIIYLPHSYLPHDSTRVIGKPGRTREQWGLPAAGFVYCSFNSSYKIMPEVFDGWMRILGRVPGSVLWLSRHNPVVTGNLQREATRRSIDEKRLIFADRVPSMADHLARHSAADLFLDTLPYNAHTTAIDALWAGLPVLTRVGDSFAGRVAASLLKSIGLPELITTAPQKYEELAVQLAENPQRLAQIRQRLEDNRLTTPLFDTPSFTRDLESAYRAAYDRYRAGLPPEHIDVLKQPFRQG